jgi:hypothetical protein
MLDSCTATLPYAEVTDHPVGQFRASLAKVTTGKNKTVSAQHINRHMELLKMILSV